MNDRSRRCNPRVCESYGPFLKSVRMMILPAMLALAVAASCAKPSALRDDDSKGRPGRKVPVKELSCGDCRITVKMNPIRLSAYASYLAWSPSGGHFFSRGEKVQIWKRDGSPVKTLEFRRPAENLNAYKTIERMFPSNDGVTEYEEIDIKIGWGGDGDTVLTASGHMLCYRPDGKAGFSLQSTVRYWDLDGKNTAVKIMPHQWRGRNSGAHQVFSLSPGGDLLYCASAEGKMMLWDLQKNTRILLQGDIPRAYNWPKSFWSADGAFLVAAVKDRMFLWRKDGTLEQEITPSPGRDFVDKIISVALSPDCKSVAVGSWDDRVHVIDVRTGATTLLGRHGLHAQCVLWSPDGNFIVTGSGRGIPDQDDRRAILWCAGAPGAEGVRNAIVLDEFDGYVRTAAWSPDGGKLLAIGSSRGISLYETEIKGCGASR